MAIGEAIPAQIERLSYQRMEAEINAILGAACHRLMSNERRVAHYSALFDRTVEGAFYSGDTAPRGQGEQPTWSPNPAYMDSLEELWIPVDEKLREHGMGLEQELRELFFVSHEYKDLNEDHRRVFHGQLVDLESGLPVTYFMMSISHSHRGFRYLTPPQIQISPSLQGATHTLAK